MTQFKEKTILSYILLLLSFWLFFPADAAAQRRISRKDRFDRTAIEARDTLTTDSIASDTARVEAKKSPLEAPVSYEAKDSIVFDQGGFIRIYGSGKVHYQKIELTADNITMNMDSSTVLAQGKVDSLGTISGKPVFKDGGTGYDSEIIRYNFKSKKGFINNVITEQGEGYVTGNNAKKGTDDELFMTDGIYTTCDHHEHPHFYLKLTRAKVRPKKNVVTGPAYLVVADVPLPLGVPFFFFPFTSNYSSGFILPSYMDDSRRGFGLTDGGYYFAINDHIDLKLKGTIFTKGSWAVGVESTYNKRYKFSGSLMADFQVTKLGEKNLPDYSKSQDFKIIWSHRQDPKANPFSSFSASVNFSTSSYERTNINNMYNLNTMSQNTKTSSISYSRSFPSIGLTLSGTANISQTMKDSSIALTLPDLNITLARMFPFKRKKAAGAERWYEKISFQYTGRLTNSIRTKDNLLFKSNFVKDWKNAMQHNIPVSATFTLFKYLNLSPSFSYTSRWYTRRVEKEYSDERRSWLPTDTIYGFQRVADYNFSLSFNTKLYGMYKPIFWKKKEIQIRHVFTPQISFSAAPGFGRYWREHQDPNGNMQYYSPYSDQPFGTAPRERRGMVSFDISNNFEMKYRDRNDSIQKISLIDEIGASLSYNMAAKKKPWSDLGFRFRFKVPKTNYTLSLNTNFATYAYTFDKNGNVVVGDRTEWSYGRFGRFSGYGTSFSYTFNNDTWKKWFGKKDEKEKQEGLDSETGEEGDDLGDLMDEGTLPEKRVEKAKANSDGYQEFKMPWSLNVSYSFNFSEDRSKPINRKRMRYPFTFTQNLNATGSLKLSNKWDISFSTGYDFRAKEVTNTTMTVTRDMHCFTMQASISPFGRWKYYNFRISANASILQDLKYEQRSQTQSNIRWY